MLRRSPLNSIFFQIGFFTVFFAATLPAAAQTNVGGPITQDTTWTRSGGPYIVTSSVFVQPNVTLTIESGVTVRFDKTHQLSIEGTLKAQGTQASPITFTSNAAIPAVKDWSQIFFSDKSQNNLIQYAKIEYSQFGLFIQKANPRIENTLLENNEFGVFLADQSSPTIIDSTIQKNTGLGLFVDKASTAVIQRCTINNNPTGIFLRAGTRAELTGNTITQNSSEGIFLEVTETQPSRHIITKNSIYSNTNKDIEVNNADKKKLSTQVIDLQQNYWGTVDPFQIADKVGGFHLFEQLPAVDFSDLLAAPNGSPIPLKVVSGELTSVQRWENTKPIVAIGDIILLPGAELTIAPGAQVVIRPGFYAFSILGGILVAEGTPSEHIVFKSGKTNPQPGDWRGFRIIAPANPSLLFKESIFHNVEIRHANDGMFVDQAAPFVVDSVIEQNHNGVVLKNGAAPRFKGGEIKNNTYTGLSYESSGGTVRSTVIDNNQDGIQIKKNSNPTVLEVNVTNNKGNGITVDASSPQITQCTIVKSQFIGIVVTGVLSRPLVEGNTIKENATGINVEQGASFLIKGNTINDNKEFGINISNGSSPTIEGNEIINDKFTGILIAGSGSNPTIRSNTIEKNNENIGIKDGASASIEDNVIRLSQVNGITLASGSPTVTGNIIKESAGFGIRIDLPTVNSYLIRNNTITDNTIAGIYIKPDPAKPPSGTITANAIFNNRDGNLSLEPPPSNLSHQIFNARENWWGTTDTQQIAGKIYANQLNKILPVVDFSRILDAAPPEGKPIPGEIVYGPVIGQKTWVKSGNPYTLIGEVEVRAGSALTIEAGVDVKVHKDLVGMTILGDVFANGTLTEPIRFSSKAAMPKPGDWRGIVFKSPSGLDPGGVISQFKFVTVNHATLGLEIDGVSPLIEDSTVEGNAFGVKILNGSSTQVKRTAVINNTFDGITIDNASPTISDNSRSDNNQTGMRIVQGASPTINQSQISRNTSHGIEINSGSKPRISLSTINNNKYYGIYLADAASEAILSENKIQNNESGVFIEKGTSGKTQIEKNEITNNTYNGLLLEAGSSPQILGNTIKDNGSLGIFLKTSSAQPSQPILNHNKFISNNPTEFVTQVTSGNLSSIKIDAHKNYWGTIDHRAIMNKIIDFFDKSDHPVVDFSFYLDENGKVVTGRYIPGQPITNDTTWKLAESPYVILGDVTVKEGVTLTIEPGVDVKVDDFYSLIIQGSLHAKANALSKISFESNLAIPHNRAWKGIVLTPTSKNHFLEYINFKHALLAVEALNVTVPLTLTQANFSRNTTGFQARGNGVIIMIDQCSFENNNTAMELSNDLSASITNTQIKQNSRGLGIQNNVAATILGNMFTGNSQAIYWNVLRLNSPPPKINNNSFIQQTSSDIFIDSSFDASRLRVDARKNWWGTTNTHTIGLKIVDFTDDARKPSVDFSQLLDGDKGTPLPIETHSGFVSAPETWAKSSEHIIVGNLTIDPNVILTINAGSKVKFNSFFSIDLLGTLNAVGTLTDRILFTSNQSSPKKNDWGSLTFRPSSQQNSIKYADIQFAQYGIYNVGSPSVSLENSLIENVTRGVFAEGSSSSTNVDSNTIKDSVVGIYLTKDAVVRITKNMIDTHTAEGIRLEDGAGANALIDGNTIVNGSFGIKILGTVAKPIIPTIQNNSLFNQNTYNLVAESASGDLSTKTIMAKNNWWGTLDLSTIQQKIFDFVDSQTSPFVNFSEPLNGPGGQPTPLQVAAAHLSTNTTWRKALSPYHIIGNLFVDQGVSLTVEPGVVVLFDNLFFLAVQGTLDAQGTSNDSITFTTGRSIKSISSWRHIALSPTSKISFVNLEYSENGFQIQNGSPSVTKSFIRYNNRGIFLSNRTTSNIADNIIISNGTGIDIFSTVANPAQPTINNNFIEKNSSANLAARCDLDCSAQTINAEQNWWGTTNPTEIAQKIIDKNDNPKYPLVDFDPFSQGQNVIKITNVTLTPKFFSPLLNETTKIGYTIDKPAEMTINIFNFSRQPARTLIQKQSRPAGTHVETWDGKDDAGQRLSPGGYQLIMTAQDAQNRFGIYDPIFVPGTVSLTNKSVTPRQFNAYKGEEATVAFEMMQPASVLLDLGVRGTPTANRRLLSDVPMPKTGNIVKWDGRDNNGNILAGQEYVVFAWTQLLPENNIYLEGNKNFKMTVKADPYAFYPKYGEFTEIEYTISHNARVTTEILNPQGNVVVKTLEKDQAKGPGTYKLTWDGLNSRGELISVAGNYRIRVSASDDLSKATIVKTGNITMLK